MTINPEKFAGHIADLVKEIPDDPAMQKAANLFTRALTRGGVIQARPAPMPRNVVKILLSLALPLTLIV